MKIALCSSYVPFVNGGYRNIVDWLELVLREKGHEVEKIYLPQVDEPNAIFGQMMAYRWVGLETADRIICFRPPAHLIPHPQKVLWFIHHIRAFYDLWDSSYRHFAESDRTRGIRDALRAVDNAGFREARAIFTNSRVVSNRIKSFNGVDSEVLYPPLYKAERFYSLGHNDEIICICRIEHHKRQQLLIEAMQYTKTPVRLRLCGDSVSRKYVKELRKLAARTNVDERVAIENFWISEERKVKLLSECLAVAYCPFDEDSYGYPCLEASCASKPILTTRDAGGVLELVEDGLNGYITEPSPQALAELMDKLFRDRVRTQIMGQRAHDRLFALKISWEHVVERLLS